jgi:hypothetical protein
MARKTYWRAWGQDPQRHGRTFWTAEEAKQWAEIEAPLSCGYAFVENTRTHDLLLYSADKARWS